MRSLELCALRCWNGAKHEASREHLHKGRIEVYERDGDPTLVYSAKLGIEDVVWKRQDTSA